MPKKAAICAFAYQSLENHAMHGGIHQVIHKTWGRKKTPLVCILPKSEIGHFSRNGCLPQVPNQESGAKNIF
jgi:hypothetical protein